MKKILEKKYENFSVKKQYLIYLLVLLLFKILLFFILLKERLIFLKLS